MRGLLGVWLLGATLTAQTGGSIPVNTWVSVTPAYTGAPDGGSLTPFGYNGLGVYDPRSQRTIVFERWFDPIRGIYIYANALIAYDPAVNTATVLKVSNWLADSSPLPANATDPTPIDRHPAGGVALDPVGQAVYLINGLNQAGAAQGYYADHPHDTWRFDLTTSRWSLIADGTRGDVHPPSDMSAYVGAMFDPPSRTVAFFEVTRSSGTKTWLLDTVTQTWRAVPQDPSASPVNISTAGLSYDARRSRILAYGGGASSGAPPSTQLWAYSVSLNRWTRLTDAPIPAADAAFACDATHDVCLGLVGSQTVVYHPSSDTWTVSPATLDRGPIEARQNVTYNPAHDVFVFQGGSFQAPIWAVFRYRSTETQPIPVPRAPSAIRIVR